MKFSEVMIYFDYKMSNISKAIQVNRQLVYYWRKQGKIPYPYQCMLDIYTDGKLKAIREDAKE